jgi:hypothetical protein
MTVRQYRTRAVVHSALASQGDETPAVEASTLAVGVSQITGLTATVAELNLLASAGAVVASGTAAANIPDPTGAVTDTDDEARAAIVLILNALEAFGIVLPAE